MGMYLSKHLFNLIFDAFAFDSSVVSRVVATKAEEVKVLMNSCARCQHALTFTSFT